jgi:hypothetical protein
MFESFDEMRKKMRDSQKYSAKLAATDKLYEAMRQFTHEIGLVAPYIPFEKEQDDWLTCRC